MKYCRYIFISLLAVILTAASCSEKSHPDSQEPVIRISEATGITRTEASVKATVEHHGGAPLSHVSLHCIATSVTPGEELIVEGDPSLTELEFQLTNLLPGCSYSCHIEAGTTTASLKSETISFNTLPNDPPSVSGITPLSTGPLGIMVGFSITDDGGEETMEAGCEVKEKSSSESRRIFANILNPVAGQFQLSITGLTPASTYSITPFASNSRGESKGETLEYTTSNSVVLKEPGTLSMLFGDDDTIFPEPLVISGPMNGDDFRTLREMSGAMGNDGSRVRVTGIDLSDAVITEGGGAYDGQRFTVANRVTAGMLADCIWLGHAVLPNSATAIERDALARCSALEILRLPADAETILPSAGCTSLKEIQMPPANPRFRSTDGVLLNGDATQIVWFPCGKTGEYTFPSTISAIGENAFSGTSITTLIIPASVTTISRGAFAGSALKDIRMPDNITNISEGMFQDCASLTTVSLGAGTDFIGDYAFDGTDLTDLYIRASYPPYTTAEALTNRRKSLAEECTLFVPKGTRDLFRNHSKWGIFTKIEEFEL